MKHEYKFFSAGDRAWMPIPSSCYRVELPVCGEPWVHDHELIVYRSIGKDGWTVAHKETSAAVAYGRTKAEAIQAASDKMLSVGEAKFIRARDYVRGTIRSMTG